MRSLKRFLAMTLTMLMVVGCCSAMFSVNAFDDVTDYQQQIELMSELKIVEGKDDTTFGFGEDVQRWHMALWIAKIMTGKVDDAYVNWYETTNYTDFTDVNADQFLGSISYASDNGIIKGYANTTNFGPADGITFQDAFTMVVRMLGYGSDAMDATYPWSYINKAIELGLDDGLAASYNNEDVATREEIVVILYNALFATKADGSNYAAAKFNLTQDTVVITGTVKGNMYQTGDTISKKDADGNYYVAFNKLNADGTIAVSPTYYLPKTQFAALADASDLEIALAVGSSFDVVTRDDFTTILYSKLNDSYVASQDVFTGNASSDGNNLTINSEAYKAVTMYSSLYNNQNTKTTSDYEIVLKDTTGANVTFAGSYVRDASLNIMSAADLTKVALYWIPTTLAVNATYPTGVYQKLVSGTYGSPDALFADPTDADWALCATIYATTNYGFADIVKTYAGVTSINAYSDTVLFDDDNDGDYDRGLYTYYTFAFVDYETSSGNKYLVADGTKIAGDTAYTAITYVDADKYFAGEADYEISAADIMTSKDTDLAHGNYVLYSYNKTTKVMMIKKIYTPVVGFVTTVSRPAATITFDQIYYGYNAGNVTGSTYAIGKATLPGATYNDVVKSLAVDFDNYSDNVESLKGRTIKYVLDEKYSAVLDMYEVADNSGYVVFVDYAQSVNTNGYINAIVYANSNVQSVITIASIDGLTNISALGNYLTAGLNTGDLFSATVDTLGMYHLTSIDEDSFTYYYDFNHGGKFVGTAINFSNAIAYPTFGAMNDFTKYGDNQFKTEYANTSLELGNMYRYDNDMGVATNFVNFKTDASTVFVLKDGRYEYDFRAAKGVPSNGNYIMVQDDYDLDQGDFGYQDAYDARIFVATKTVDGYPVATFVYVVDGMFNDGATFNVSIGSYVDSNDTIIYADDDTIASMVATNQTYTGNGVTVGTSYTYKNAIDFIKGGLTSVYTNSTYNAYLKAGHFYYVHDGYVQNEVTVDSNPLATDDNSNYDIQIVELNYIEPLYSAYTTYSGRVSNKGLTSFATQYLYSLTGTEVKNTSDSDITPKNMVSTMMATVNDDDSYAVAYAYVGTQFQNATSKVFIYTTITSGTDATTSVKLNAATGAYTATVNNATRYATMTALVSPATADYNFFKIDLAAYNALSVYGTASTITLNDTINNVYSFDAYKMSWNAKTQSLIKLYDKSGNIISDFNSDNLFVYTFTQKNQHNAEYYLAFETNDYKTFEISASDCTLVFTNPNSITSYKIALPYVGISYTEPVDPTDVTIQNTNVRLTYVNKVQVNTDAGAINASVDTDTNLYHWYNTTSGKTYTELKVKYIAKDSTVKEITVSAIEVAGSYSFKEDGVTVEINPDENYATKTYKLFKIDIPFDVSTILDITTVTD